MADNRAVTQEHDASETSQTRPAEASARPAPKPPGDAGEEHLAAGTMVEHFRVMRLLGEGGMGAVYLARDTKLGRKVALKLLRGLGSDEEVQLFLREARTTARFAHPHIVTIYAVGEGGPRDEPYVALEYLEGRTLRSRINGDPPSMGEVPRIALAIARALAEAHGHAILHRDLKPANVMLPPDGRLRVLDFGLAKTFQERADADLDRTLPADAETASLGEIFKTSAGQITGTPRYMAPEQWRGEEVSGATDIWALGLILYELVSGQHPFEGAKYLQLALEISQDGPMPAPAKSTGAPAALLELIEACLRKAPDQRPSADEVVESLERMLHRGPRSSSEECPFRGLATFGAEHAELFFGRENELGAFMERLRQVPVLPVVGPSGAGKSSFVQAGVIPRLGELRRLVVLQLRPGRHPERALAARLSAPQATHAFDTSGQVGSSAAAPTQPPRDREGESTLAAELLATPGRLALALREIAEREQALVLLFVDQLEELYTLDHRPEVQQAFLRAICGAADDPLEPVRVIFTLRDDFLGRLQGGSEVREALAGVTVLSPPGPLALQEILEAPLARQGYHYDDPALVQEMITAVEGELSALPLLSFTCQLLWERRDRRTKQLLRAVHDDLGGVAGALARHADSVLEAFSAAQTRWARTLLVRLVTPEGTREVLPRGELLAGVDTAAAEVLDRLIAARLLTQRKARDEREAQIELTHGSLIRSWARLARWLDESGDERALRTEIEQAAELWRRRGARLEEAWQGPALADAERAVARHELELSERAAAFLAAGQRLAARRTWTRRGLLALGFVFLAAIALTFFLKERETAREKRRAEGERQLAQRQRRRAEVARARAELEGARAAYARGALLEARSKLRGALERHPSRLGRALWAQLSKDPRLWSRNLGTPLHAIAISPDGRWVAAGGQNKAIYLLSTQTQRRRVLRGHGDQVRALAFAPNGRRLASASWSGQVFVWNLARGTRKELRGHRGPVVALAFSPDGTRLASASWDKTVRVWPSDGEAPTVLHHHSARVLGVAFAPKGGELASAGLDGTVRVTRLATPTQTKVVGRHRGGAAGVAYSRDGKTLASIGRDHVVRLWDWTTGRPLAALAGPPSTLWAVAFASTDRHLITAGEDGRLWVFDVRTGRSRTLKGHHGAIYTLAATGRAPALVASAGIDKTVRVWRLKGRQGRQKLTSAVWGLAFTADGKEVFAGAHDYSLRRWRVGDGALQGIYKGHTSTVISTAASPDGKLIATGGGDRTLRLWNAASGASVETLLGHRADVLAVAFAPNGRFLASGSSDKNLILWDLATRRRRRTLGGFSGAIWDVAFAPDSKVLAASSRDKTIRLFDPESGRLRRVLKGHEGGVFGIAFAADGRSLFSGSGDGTLRRWDVARGSSRTIARVKGRFYFVAADPKGRYVAASASDGIPRIFSVRGGPPVARLLGHRAEANYLRFSPDGKLLTTSSDDGTVRLWHVPSGRPRWHAPGMFGAPPRTFDQRGWRFVGATSSPPPGAPPSAWRRAAETARWLSAAPRGQDLCLATFDGHLELWRRGEDRRLFRTRVGAVDDLLALSGGCVTTGKPGARYYALDGSFRPLGEARALARDGDGFLLAKGEGVIAYDRKGLRQRAYGGGDSNVSAMTRVNGKLLLGFSNGSVEGAAGALRGGLSFEGLPSSPVVRMLAGPPGTLIAGFANGLVGLWSLDSGLRLAQTYLHGPARHLRLEKRRLLALSALGDDSSIDLEAFYQDRCALLRAIWAEVPSIWRGGRPRLADPPPEHPCRRRRSKP